jgi:hypothetical protein
MQHLMIETLARLVDETPTPEEAAHLDACAACRAELEGMRADVAALANLPMIEPPPTEWPELEGRLLEEGLVRRAAGTSTWRMTALRTAASIALFAGGLASGIAWTKVERPLGIRPTANGPSTFTGQTGYGSPTIIAATEPASPEETVLLYRQAEALYLDMLGRMSALETQEQSVDPLARIAALESIVAITRSALDQAPADPVLNGYHLTALAQKEATLRQIAASKPGRWF